MKLSNLAQIAEIASGIAVLVTLVILVLEIRENTAATQAISYGQSVQRLNEWRLKMADADHAAIFVAYKAGTWRDLERVEIQRLDFMMSGLWAVYESAYFSKGYEILGDSEWRRYEKQICHQYKQSVDVGFWENSRPRLSDDFASFIATHWDGGT